GMIGFICRLQARKRKLSADLPGTTHFAPRLLPPFMSFSWLLMSNLPSVTLPVWQTKHLFLKIGSISAPYSTGMVRLRSTVGMGGKSFFGSWAARAAVRVMAASSVSERMVRSSRIRVFGDY